MNFLAHAHLSGNNDELLVGNFIADSVKGKEFARFPARIQQGITLHRQIDMFTDSHTIFKQSLGRVRVHQGKYSGVVVDIFYDHFLAKNWNQYSMISLPNFAEHVYKLLHNHFSILPERTKRLLPYLKSQNWLVGYANFTDLESVFFGMDRRTGLVSGMKDAVKTLQLHYDTLQEDFRGFYPAVQIFSANEISKLNYSQ